MATVPNTTSFSLQDVVNVTGGSSLTAAFAASTDAFFDPSYKGSKNNLLNFRNYDTSRGYSISLNIYAHSGTGSFTVTVTASSTTTWTASSGSYGGWISLTGQGPKTGNGSFTINVAARPTGGSGTTGYVSVTSQAPIQTISIQRP
jgi:hypothetical protein